MGPFEGFAGMVEDVDEAAQPPEGDGVDLRPGNPGRTGIHAGVEKHLTCIAWEASAPQGRDRPNH